MSLAVVQSDDPSFSLDEIEFQAPHDMRAFEPLIIRSLNGSITPEEITNRLTQLDFVLREQLPEGLSISVEECEKVDQSTLRLKLSGRDFNGESVVKSFEISVDSNRPDLFKLNQIKPENDLGYATIQNIYVILALNIYGREIPDSALTIEAAKNLNPRPTSEQPRVLR